MPGSKSRQVGTAGLVSRHRDGTCTHTCGRCQQWEAFAGWRTALRAARAHAADHHATQTRYLPTPTGINALGHHATRRAPRRRGAAAMVIVLLLAALSFTVADMTSRAGSAPAPTTTQVPYEYTPVPAGPPANPSVGGDR
jgi:ferric-dicitrate binding protein FerR (iron transport regulator)